MVMAQAWKNRRGARAHVCVCMCVCVCGGGGVEKKEEERKPGKKRTAVWYLGFTDTFNFELIT